VRAYLPVPYAGGAKKYLKNVLIYSLLPYPYMYVSMAAPARRALEESGGKPGRKVTCDSHPRAEARTLPFVHLLRYVALTIGRPFRLSPFTEILRGLCVSYHPSAAFTPIDKQYDTGFEPS
jgi:hypothetical protein